MNIILNSIGIISVIGIIAGQIYIIGYCLRTFSKTIKKQNIFVRIAIILVALEIINLLSIFFGVSYPIHTKLRPSLFLLITSSFWYSFIVAFGWYCLVRGYWHAYKRRFGKA